MINIWDLGTYDGDVQDYLKLHQEAIRLHRERALELDKIEPPIVLQERIRFQRPTNEHYCRILPSTIRDESFLDLDVRGTPAIDENE